MKLTILENGNVRIGFREQIEVKPDEVIEQVHKAISEVMDQSNAMLEVYGSKYFKKEQFSTILVTESGISTSATRPAKKAEEDE